MMKLMSIRRGPSWSIRIKSTVISAVVVALSLVAGGVLLVVFVYSSATQTVNSAASARLQDLVTELATTPPDALDPLLFATDRNVVVVQLVDTSGTIVRSSTGAPNTVITEDGRGLNERDDGRERRGGHVAVDTATVTSPAGDITVAIGVGDGDADDTIAKVAVLLAILTPIVTGIAAAATYFFVGQSLRSMERLRRRLSEITAADLGERVTVSDKRDEISALAATMNDMLARLDDSQSAQRRFVSDASHELRSPLATIAGALELGREDLDTLDTELLDHTLLPEVARVQQLVEDLLTLARADEGGIPIGLEDVDLDDIAQNEARLLRGRSSHEVVVHLSPTRIRGDENALTRVLRNLTVNAARHARSRIEIDVHHDSTTAYLEVGDDGPGIAADDRVRVFDRFVRLEEHRGRAQGGAGLGLAIVAEIVAAHQGTIDITERAGGGTLVTVRLPFTPDV